MKAILCKKYKAYDSLVIKDVKKPTINKNEVLIRVMASTVSSGDCVVRGATNPFVKLVFGLRKPRNPILGTDLAGIIEGIGENVSDFNIGDHVIASTGMKFGCHAEYVALNKKLAIIKIPNSLSFNDAVTLSFGGVAALHYLKKMEKRNHPKILIYGASGAVGTSSVQLAKHYGFEVSAVCSSKNVEFIRELGADFVVSYTSPNWQTNLKKYDYIFDAVGKTKEAEWFNYLRSKEGFHTISKGFVKENTEDMELLVQLAMKGELKPVIDKSYTMNQIVDAYKYVETGRKKGNVVLDFSDAVQ